MRPGPWFQGALVGLFANGPFQGGLAPAAFFGASGILRGLMTGLRVGLNVSVVATLARRGYLAQVASRDAGYVLMRAPETIRIRDLVAELMHEGGGHAEIEGVLMLDAPLKETMAKIEAGVAQGFGDLTLADMVAAASAGKPA